MTAPRDHGGALDAAVAQWGGERADWIDLSTGINPRPYPLPELPPQVWTALPDGNARSALETAARAFWQVPDRADLLAAPGASCLIAQLPFAIPGDAVQIRADTYNEHAAAFRSAGWRVGPDPATVRVVVHPNNPTGEFAALDSDGTLILDESFCDTHPRQSLMHCAGPGCTILKSFGKFWGLGGLRLGFAIGAPDLIDRLRRRLGPWPVSGPALAIGTAALSDPAWADATRSRLTADAAALDNLLRHAGATVTGDCPLFRLCQVTDAAAWARHFARHRILTRTFSYKPTWLRLGLPGPADWPRIAAACGTVGGAMAQPSVARRP